MWFLQTPRYWRIIALVTLPSRPGTKRASKYQERSTLSPACGSLPISAAICAMATSASASVSTTRLIVLGDPSMRLPDCTLARMRPFGSTVTLPSLLFRAIIVVPPIDRWLACPA